MQPNQQDPYTHNTLASQNPNIPDYLHMDPIVNPVVERNKRKKKILRGVLFLIAILMIAAIGLLISWYLNYNSPQEKLYRAFENSLRTTYVERKYSTVYRGFAYDAKLKAEAKSDFSEPALPKSTVKLLSDRTSDNEKVTYDVDYVMNEKDAYTAMINGKPEGSLATNVVSGQWYRMKFNSATLNNIDYHLDQLPKRQMFNTAQGMLPMGNFSTEQRTRLIDYIKANNIYTVIKSEAKQDVRVYTINLNVATLNGLNKEIATTLNSKPTYNASRYLSGTSSLTITVDNKSERIVQTKYTAPADGNYQFQGMIDYSYPANMSITVPNDVESLSGGINL
jgi:hypothetical protein